MAIRFGVGLVIVRLHVEFKFVTKDGASSVGPIKHDRFADMCDFKLSHRIRQARPTGLRLLGRRSPWIARDHPCCSAVYSHTVEPETPFAESATHRHKALRKAFFRLVRGCYSPRRRRKRTVAHADTPTGFYVFRLRSEPRVCSQGDVVVSPANLLPR